ncbi:MAG: hypothetical protein GQ527_10660 [Bacteroidales bacterium]|nr:hypothetical protein [Bacteroidales bacterium]
MLEFIFSSKNRQKLAQEKIAALENENLELKKNIENLQNPMEPIHEWKSLYGDFEYNKDYNALNISGLDKESGWIRGEIVHAVKQIKDTLNSALLPGEDNGLKKVYSNLLAIPEQNIKTTGLHSQVDYEWNFEKAHPPFGKFDIIITQAMLEHLIDPYSHVKDLANSLNQGGYLILHTVVPGFPYHRYPIDCMRFYPDWFEEVAKRLQLDISYKYIGEKRILYCFHNLKKSI